MDDTDIFELEEQELRTLLEGLTYSELEPILDGMIDRVEHAFSEVIAEMWTVVIKIK